MKKTLIAALILTAMPLVASAVFGDVSGYITQIGVMIVYLTRVMAALALLAFFWGLVKFISKAGDEGAVEEGRRLMIWGVVALFVMVSVWGLTAFIGRQLDIPTGSTPNIPSFTP